MTAQASIDTVGTCEAREGDSGRVQQLLHGEPGG